MRKSIMALAAGAALCSSPALALDWYVAETEHFKVYSEDTAEQTEDFVRDLERLDEVLRIISGVGFDDGPMRDAAKVVVYRFGETKDMATLAGAPGSGIGGFFMPRASGSYAFVPRRENMQRGSKRQARGDGLALEPKAVLFHEYTHYFMYQHHNAPYPAWYREGIAEVFSTLEIKDDGFTIGDVPSWRSIPIMAVNLDVEAMMAPTPKNGGYSVARIYGHGWLLTSLLNFTPERRPQINQYITLLAKGTEPLEAARTAFGDLDQLQKDLDKYRRSAALVLNGKFRNKEEPKVAIRQLTPQEASVVELVMQSKVGVDEKAAAKQLPTAREAVSRNPDSVPVLLAAAEVEFDNRNYAESEALVRKVLELEPKSTDATIRLANIALMQSLDKPEMLSVARDRFVAANKLVNDHPVPLYGYYLTYLLSGEPVPNGAQDALESAYSFAPFDNGIRQTLIHMFLTQGELGIAKELLSPLIQTAHGSDFAKCLNKELALYDAGDKEPLLKRLKPDHPAIKKSEEEQDAEREEIKLCAKDA